MKLFVSYKYRPQYKMPGSDCYAAKFGNDVIEYENNIDSIGDIRSIEDIIGERNKDYYYIVLIDWKVLEP